MTRPPRVPPADWSPRDSGGGQEGNLNAEALVARMQQLRGIQGEAQDAFFHPDLDDLHDPLLMLGMEQAVDRLMLAQRRGERIMAYGDYDVDGATSDRKSVV